MKKSKTDTTPSWGTLRWLNVGLAVLGSYMTSIADSRGVMALDAMLLGFSIAGVGWISFVVIPLNTARLEMNNATTTMRNITMAIIQESHKIPGAGRPPGYEGRHQYPGGYGPDSKNPWVITAWSILDELPPDALKTEHRFYIGGKMAGSLHQAFELGKNER